MPFNVLAGFEFLIALLIPHFMFVMGCERRKYFIIRILLVLCGCIGATFFIEWMNFASEMATYYLSVLLYLGMVVASIYLCFKINVFTVVFVFVGGYSIQHLNHSLCSILFYYMGNLGRIWNHIIRFSLLILISGAIYFGFIKRNSVDYYVKKIDVTAILLAIVMLVINFVMNELVASVSNDRLINNVICKIYAVFSCVLVLYIVFSHFKQNKLQYEKVMLQNMFKQRQHQFDVFSANIDQMNIKFHDLKKRLSALMLIDNAEEREKYIEGLKSTLSIYDSRANTGNKALDTLLSEKNLYCLNNKIKFSHNINGSLFSFMELGDVYVLFSNLLDNAIESVEKTDEEGKRTISFICANKNNCVYVNLSNYCANEVEFENGLPKTKKSTVYHGFGTKSIAQLVKKYNGILKMDLNDHIFTVEMLFTPEK